MPDIPKHAVLRDEQRWEASRTRRLAAAVDGALSLIRVPGARASEAIQINGPWEVGVSGLALGEDRRRYVVDTDNDRVLCYDVLCDSNTLISAAGFKKPQGIAISNESLYVADSGNARIQVFRLPTLEVKDVWHGPFLKPTAISSDSVGRLYVLDAGRNSVLRLSASGELDRSYDDTLAVQAILTAPAFLTIDRDDILYVSDGATNRVHCFDADGKSLGVLVKVHAERPRALLAVAGLIYVADAATGLVHAFDIETQEDLGILPGFRGPVRAMAVDDTGALLTKTDGVTSIVRLPANTGCVPDGELIAGPLDAGGAQIWERLQVEIEQERNSRATVDVFLTPTDADTPGETDWLPASSLDTLLPPPTGGDAQSVSARFLWVRVGLSSQDRYTSPALSQVHATTTAPSYIDDLPAVYAREDSESGFLRRWLALFRAELGDTETLLDGIARRFDPVTTPVDHLQWLAGWLGFELPGKNAPDWSIEWLREMIEKAHAIHTRRGTKIGLCDAVERHTGIRPEILEAYRDRHIWQLGATSRLGFDTGLAPARPDGAVVPDTREALVVGEFVVDQSGPQRAEDFGAPLFDDTAHLFSVVLPAGRCIDDEVARLKDIVDAEKPAHTDYHLCLIDPSMRVGFQARVGLDTIVAGPREPFALDVSRLGLDSFTNDTYRDGAARVAYRSAVGQTTRLG